MTTAIVIHEVQNADAWAKAWRRGPGSRHEMFAKVGVKARTFRDPDNPKLTGLILELPDLAKLKAFLETDEGKTAMREDGLKVESLRFLTEFVP